MARVKDIVGTIAIISFSAFCGYTYGQATAKENRICKIWVSHNPTGVNIQYFKNGQTQTLLHHTLEPLSYSHSEWINLCEEVK